MTHVTYQTKNEKIIQERSFFALGQANDDLKLAEEILGKMAADDKKLKMALLEPYVTSALEAAIKGEWQNKKKRDEKYASDMDHFRDIMSKFENSNVRLNTATNTYEPR